MKIFPTSDFHLDFYSHKKSREFINKLPNDCDIMIFAGDLCQSKGLEYKIPMLCDRFNQVILVLGNHCYYDSTFPDVEDKLAKTEASLSNLVWLENKRIEINGQGFVGAVGWFPEYAQSKMLKHCLSDFSWIEKCDPIAFEKYEETFEFFRNNVKKGDICITHHIPSWDLIHTIYKQSRLNIYFANDMDKIIEENEPSYWFYGHTHLPKKDKLYNTKCICNPCGYPKEQLYLLNDHFDSNMIIEV